MNKNRNRYAWFSDVEPDSLSDFGVVPDFSENLKILEITNPIDPKTGFPISDLGLYFNSQVSDDVKELIARNLQRLGVTNSTQGLSDEQLISVLPSRYVQSLGEVSEWRNQLEQFIKSDYGSILQSYQRDVENVTPQTPDTSAQSPTDTATSAPSS